MSDHHDILQPFLLPGAGVRGALVRLDASWREVASRAAYPPALHQLLGESLAAAALMTSSIKFDGSLSLQLKSAATPRLLFAECTDAGRLRGLVRWDDDATLPSALDLSTLPEAVFAITIGRADGHRYQGLVPLESTTLAQALEGYFQNSEQLPARIRLAVAGDRCAGLLLQRMPAEGGKHAGDADGWNRVGHLFATLGDEELVSTDPVLLLQRLFHEETPQVFPTRELAFGCSCSRGRVASMLLSLGRDEVDAALAANADEVEVHCEFCASRHVFDRIDVEQLFAGGVEAGSSLH